MAQEVRTFTFTVPKGGTALAPQVFPLTMPPRIVKNVELFFPAGNGGQLWIALGMAGTHIIPANAGQYITAENNTLKWPLDNFPDSGAWQLFAYNSGNYAHMLQIRFLVNIPGEPEAATPNLTETLNIVGDGSGGGFGGGGGGGGGGTFDFRVPASIAPASPIVGATDITSVQVTEVTGHAASYTVTVVGLPVGVTVQTALAAAPLTYTITFTAAKTAPIGPSIVEVRVSAGGVTRSADCTLTVRPAGGGGDGGGGGTAVAIAAQQGGNVQHLPVGTKFYIVVEGIKNRQYHYYDANGNLQSDITTDSNGRAVYPASGTFTAFSGMNYSFNFCLQSFSSSASCLSANVLCP